MGVIVLAIALGITTFALKGKNSPDLPLGDQTFQAGRTDRLAPNIERDGPQFYSDVGPPGTETSSSSTSATTRRPGRYAFLAAPADKARDCTWQWQADEEQFRARCDRSLTAPADGEGLPQFKVTVANGRIEVDLNADAKAAAKTTSSTTEADG